MVNSLLEVNNNVISYVLIGVMVAILIVSMVLMNRRSKKRQQEAQDLIDAVKPGNKVKTIGGICGIVVEVDPEDDTFVLETGTENSGKCYIKFVRQAIYESDAVVEKDGKDKREDKVTEEETKQEEPSVQVSEKQLAETDEKSADKE